MAADQPPDADAGTIRKGLWDEASLVKKKSEY